MHDSFASINDIKWERVFVKLYQVDNLEHINRIIMDAKTMFTPEEANGINIFNYFDDTKTMGDVKLILDIIFKVIILITVFLCFFSLASSMGANLID